MTSSKCKLSFFPRLYNGVGVKLSRFL